MYLFSIARVDVMSTETPALSISSLCYSQGVIVLCCWAHLSNYFTIHANSCPNSNSLIHKYCLKQQPAFECSCSPDQLLFDQPTHLKKTFLWTDFWNILAAVSSFQQRFMWHIDPHKTPWWDNLQVNSRKIKTVSSFQC